MRLSAKPVLDAARIAGKCVELGRTLAEAYRGKHPVLLVALKGAAPFAMDLARAMDIPLEIDFIRARSYAGTASTGAVTLSCLPEIPLRNRHVLVVEDIFDTGLTAAAILERVRAEKPASLAMCALLDKDVPRRAEVTLDYRGFRIPNLFVVGYGLDYNEAYRNLPAIHTLETGEVLA